MTPHMILYFVDILKLEVVQVVVATGAALRRAEALANAEFRNVALQLGVDGEVRAVERVARQRAHGPVAVEPRFDGVLLEGRTRYM